MNKHCKLLFFILFVLVFLSCTFYHETNVFAQTDQAASKLQSANNLVEAAFNAVLDAEKAGANITALLNNLNNAENILAQAENSYRTGDLNTTLARANSIFPIAQEVITSAQDAKQTALVSGQNTFWSTIAFTATAGFVFVLVLFLVWRRFKRGYIDSLSEAKPEVVDP